MHFLPLFTAVKPADDRTHTLGLLQELVNVMSCRTHLLLHFQSVIELDRSQFVDLRCSSAAAPHRPPSASLSESAGVLFRAAIAAHKLLA